MAFWRVEVWTDQTSLNYFSDFVGVLGDYKTYHKARKAAKKYQYKVGRNNGTHCEIFKCGGTPLQHGIDGTKRHCLY